jgi:hypothetical protein
MPHSMFPSKQVGPQQEVNGIKNNGIYYFCQKRRLLQKITAKKRLMKPNLFFTLQEDS